MPSKPIGLISQENASDIQFPDTNAFLLFLRSFSPLSHFEDTMSIKRLILSVSVEICANLRNFFFLCKNNDTI